MKKENRQQGEENGTEKGKEIEEEIVKDSKSGGEKKRGREQGQVRPWREVTLPAPKISPWHLGSKRSEKRVWGLPRPSSG